MISMLLLRKNIYKIFWVIVFVGIIAVLFRLTLLDLIFKPLIIPALLAAVMLRSENTRGRNKIILALVFSFLGDVFLQFENRGQYFFIAGLASFLITHIFYIAYFYQIKQSGPSPAKNHPFIPVIIALYTFGLLYLLNPYLGELKIPVIIYACIISIMVYLGLCIPYKVGKITSRLFVTGAILFVVSDSLLAINKFYSSFSAAPVLIRLTYCVAQYFIVKGFIKKRY